MTDIKLAVETISKYLRVHSPPIALKWVDNLEKLPQGVQRPSEYGGQMAFCQIFSIVRKWDLAFAVEPENINCVAALLSLGWGDLAEGLNKKEEYADFVVNAGYIKDRETAMKNLDENSPLMKEEKISAKALIVAPLESETIPDPDVIVIYGNPAQMSRMAQAMIYSEGTAVELSADFGISCFREMVTPMLENKAVFVTPGRGARILAGIGDDEMAFSLPVGKLDSLLTGLKITHENGTRYPINQSLFFEPTYWDAIEKLRTKMQKMDS
ncbi:MAG: DUF169 domain-containing protein [Thermodesulfobacteriota bacterium]